MADYRSPWMDEELELFRDAARRFVQSEILPHDARFREQHHVDREHSEDQRERALGVSVALIDVQPDHDDDRGRHEDADDPKPR